VFFESVGKIIGKYGAMFLQGAEITLLIAIIGTLIGFVIGLGIGVVRTIPVDAKSSPVKRVLLKIVNALLAVYIEIFRGTPMIVQAMVIFYGFAALTGISLNRIIAGIVIVSINTGAYMAEIVRGGILSIDKGQFEAAHSIGMTHGQTMTSVVLPQAIRNILPATGNEFVINIKDTSVLNVISVSELYFKTSTVAAKTYDYFASFFIACVLYFIMTFTVTRILRAIERRMDGPKTFRIHGSQTVPEAELKITDGGEKKRWIRY
jgi:putative lysine transport system permease protein